MSFADNQRQARELTLQILFHGEYDKESDSKTRIYNFQKSFKANDEVWNYALKIIDGIETHRPSIDTLIERHSNNWTINRMALVDANILRIATCEIHFLNQDVPPKVAINEAIEISKKYGSTESSQFVSGILGNLMNDAPLS